MKKLLCVIAIAGMSSGAWAVMKCTGDGKTRYQDAPCPAGSTGEQIQLNVPPAAPALPVPTVVNRKETAEPQGTGTRLPTSSNGAPSSALEQEAEMCLAWYQREIPMASGAKYLSFAKDDQVLTIMISMSVSTVNPAGARVAGTTLTPAPCEIRGGALDDGWTRIHAKRNGWIQ